MLTVSCLSSSVTSSKNPDVHLGGWRVSVLAWAMATAQVLLVKEAQGRERARVKGLKLKDICRCFCADIMGERFCKRK